MGSDRPIQVAVAVVIDRRGRVLIAQRPAGKHLAGCWEFPGGKIEAGETPRQGLARELEEELGITIDHPRPLMRLSHAYPTGEVLLDVWVVRRYRGEPRGLDGQALVWCSRRALAAAELLPADQPIVKALYLPERLQRAALAHSYRVVNFEDLPQGAAGANPVLKGVLCRNAPEAHAAAAGADFLAMRAALPPEELAALCARLDIPLYAHGIALERSWILGATGVTTLA